jgi:hypothetical protein
LKNLVYTLESLELDYERDCEVPLVICLCLKEALWGDCHGGIARSEEWHFYFQQFAAWESVLTRFRLLPPLGIDIRGTSESKRSLLIATTVCDAMLEMFLKDVPRDVD